jgi:hypothetical protein
MTTDIINFHKHYNHHSETLFLEDKTAGHNTLNSALINSALTLARKQKELSGCVLGRTSITCVSLKWQIEPKWPCFWLYPRDVHRRSNKQGRFVRAFQSPAERLS